MYKVRLVQNSNNKLYYLEEWKASTIFPLGRDPIKTGRWELRNNITLDPKVRTMFHDETQARVALAEWVNELTSKTIIIEEIEITNE